MSHISAEDMSQPQIVLMMKFHQNFTDLIVADLSTKF